MRLFLDANILFSAAYREGSAIELLFELARAGRCRLFTSPFAAEDARRNIAAKTPQRSGALERLLSLVTWTPEPSLQAVAATLDHGVPPKDGPILAAAIQAGTDVLVTGDRKHFGHLYGTSVQGVAVMTVAPALEKIVAGEA